MEHIITNKQIMDGMKSILPSIKKPDVIVCISRNALFFTMMIAKQFDVKNIIFEESQLGKDNLPTLYYVFDKIGENDKKILVVDDICNVDKKLGIVIGNNNVETFAFCVYENSLFIPTYKCFKVPNDIQIKFEWD